MTGQLDIFGGTTVIEENALTDRQQFALDEISKADGGLSSDELGACMHERRGKHERGLRCEWCQQEGLSVAKELRRKGLVVHKRSGMWLPVRPLAAEDGLSHRGGSSSASSGGAGDHGERTSAAARLSDPPTSHAAAASVRDLTGKQQAVLDCFRRHPEGLSDEQLVVAYNAAAYVQQSLSGLRTRRHELVERGLLRDSGRKGKTEHGRESIIWEPAGGWIPL